MQLQCVSVLGSSCSVAHTPNVTRAWDGKHDMCLLGSGKDSLSINCHYYCPKIEHSSRIFVGIFLFCFCLSVFCFYLFFVFPDRVSLCSFGACPRTSSCKPGYSQTHRDPPASATQVLELKVCTTTPSHSGRILEGSASCLSPLETQSVSSEVKNLKVVASLLQN